MKFEGNIDLNKFQILNPVAQNLSSAPGTPSNGQWYYDTTLNQFGFRQNAAWVYLSAVDLTNYMTATAADNAGQVWVSGGADRSAQVFSGAAGSLLKITTNAVLATATAGTDFLTEGSTNSLTNKTFNANGTGNSLSNVEVADFAASAIVTEAEGLNSSDNDTSIPTTAAVKDYVDSLASSGGYTNEDAQDAVGAILTDTDTIDFTYTDATPTITAAVKVQMSITSDASGIKLSGDSSSPGNSKYYGTNGSGTKGYYDLPGSQSYAHGKITTKTITNDASGVLIDGWTLASNSSDFALDNTDDSIKYTGSTTKNFLVNVSGTASYTQTVASTGIFEVELRELVGSSVEAQITHTIQNQSGTSGQKVQVPFTITAIVSMATNDKLGLYGVDTNATGLSIIHKDINMTIVSLI